MIIIYYDFEDFEDVSEIHTLRNQIEKVCEEKVIMLPKCVSFGEYINDNDIDDKVLYVNEETTTNKEIKVDSFDRPYDYFHETMDI